MSNLKPIRSLPSSKRRERYNELLNPVDLGDLQRSDFEDLEPGPSDSEIEPSEIPLNCLRTAQHLFQARFNHELAMSTVDHLIDALTENPGTLVPALKVLSSSQGPVVVNGHHRLAAYLACFGDDDPKKAISVEWLESYEQAQGETINGNGVQQIALKNEERMQYAWKQLWSDAACGASVGEGETKETRWKRSYSQEVLSERFNVSVSSIKNMRGVLNDIRDVFTTHRTCSANSYVDSSRTWQEFMRSDPLEFADARWRWDVVKRLETLRNDGPLPPLDFEYDHDEQVRFIVSKLETLPPQLRSGVNKAEAWRDALEEYQDHDLFEAVFECSVSNDDPYDF